MNLAKKIKLLEELEAEHNSKCSHCFAQRHQLNFVFGEGNSDADIMFVGEGPGAEEDRLGRPFVGRAGKLLDEMIVAMGLAREDVYIANIVKVRPPENRVPTPEEAMKCSPYLIRQIKIIEPKAIVGLGATSCKYLLGEPAFPITKRRGVWEEYEGVPFMPTFHPAYLLRNYTKDARGQVWDDLKKVLAKVGLPVPK